jgi:hypothetical protein
MTREQYEKRVVTLLSRYPYLFAGEHLAYDIVPGWLGIVEGLCARIRKTFTAAERRAARFLRVREKFGGLRIYVQPIPLPADGIGRRGRRAPGARRKKDYSCVYAEVAPLIEDAEAESRRTCIFCDAPGRLRRDRQWRLALCDKHEQCTYRDLDERFEEVTAQ